MATITEFTFGQILDNLKIMGEYRRIKDYAGSDRIRDMLKDGHVNVQIRKHGVIIAEYYHKERLCNGVDSPAFRIIEYHIPKKEDAELCLIR